MAALQSPQLTQFEPLLTILLNEISTIPEHFVLILDDYHSIDSQPVDNSLEFLVEHQPPQMHLVIITREDPQLPLARYRARGQLTELRAADLRFTPDEATELLNQVTGLGLSVEIITALETRTERWIAGLQLAAISMQGHKDAAGFIQSFTGSHRFVMDYLLEEVLQLQPESIQRFLLQTSILDRMCGPLCDAILLDSVAFALTEPHAGSDAANLRTTARHTDGGYVLNGTKQFITSGAIAGIVITFAATDATAGKKGHSAFIVPTDRRGFRVGSVEKKLGRRASDTAQLVYEDVFVEEALRVGEEGEGYRIALANLETGRIGIAAQSVGMAEAALEQALAYARDRRAFGKALTGHQAVAFRLADMATDVEAARQMVLHAASLKDAGQPCLKQACMAKLFASERAERVASAAIQVLGGYGYVENYLVEKIYRDVRVCQIYEGTSDIQRVVISREISR